MKTRLLLIFALCFFLISCGENREKEAPPQEEKKSEISAEQEQNEDEKVILFFGNSLTAGMGLAPNEAFPSVIQEKIDSLQLPYRTVNAGLSGETTASGKNRVEWVLNQDVEIFVLELGANDGLRGIPLEETRRNLEEIIEVVRSKNPDTQIILAGMQIPPNMGPDYTADFQKIYPELAEKYDLELIPFLLEGVAGNPQYNQEDGIHPTAQGNKIVAENVWKVLKSTLNQTSKDKQ